MAVPIRISPFDLTPYRGIGIAVPFNGTTGFNSTFTSKDAIRANLINFFLTDPEERPLNPVFGAGLRKYIFDPLTSTSIQGINSLITNALDEYFPRVIVKDLKINSYPESNAIQVYLAYSISETNITDEVTLTFQQ